MTRTAYSEQGQCGYGTSLEAIAAQRRQEWAIGANLAAFAGTAGAAGDVAEHQLVPTGGGGMSGGPGAWQQQAQLQEAAVASAAAQGLGFIRQPDQHLERQAEVEEARRCCTVWHLAADHCDHVRFNQYSQHHYNPSCPDIYSVQLSFHISRHQNTVRLFKPSTMQTAAPHSACFVCATGRSDV